MLKLTGKGCVADFLADRIAYRSLNPSDPNLPGLESLSRQLGLPAGLAPRKSELDYARVVVELLKHSQHIHAPGVDLKQIVFIGDTRRNDGLTFDNLCRVSGLPGVAFIGDETSAPALVEMATTESGQTLYLSNRWSALLDTGEKGFAGFCRRQGLEVDEHTAVLIDLDKTALAARGRNAQVIDQARVQAVEDTVAESSGEGFDPQAFRVAYDRLNQPEYHSFTADNQDYLAYICLILGSGLVGLQELLGAVQSGSIEDFRGFIALIERRSEELPPVLQDLHADIYARVKAGDPTPFKAFRHNEYLATVRRMGTLEENAPLERFLQEEILLTYEVASLAQRWGAQGALLFGLSDKPDEASIPTHEQAAQGYQPIHRTSTHILGDMAN